MEKLHVLFVLDKLSKSSGVCNMVLNYYSHLSDSVHCDFLVHADTPEFFTKLLKEKGSKIYQMPNLKVENFLSYLQQLSIFFSYHSNYQIVHGHIANAAVFYLGMAKKYRVPIRIIHSHNSVGADTFLRRGRNRLLNFGIRFVATDFFACSDKAAKFLFGNRHSIQMYYNAIDLDMFQFSQSKREQIRAELHLESRFVVGHVGRFCRQKNHSFLLRLFREVHERNNNAFLLLFGDGELLSKVQKEVGELNLTESVRFMGADNDMGQFYQAMDVFVLPSLFEGLPLVGVEAQATALPCVFADNITRMVKLRQQTEFISLKEPIGHWSERILATQGYLRQTNSWLPEKLNFDIVEQAHRLEQFYCRVVNPYG